MQRVVGAAVLFLAVVLLLAVPRIFPAGTAGFARVAPLPLPPAVGSCLLTAADDAVLVPCATPHDAEVTMNWRAEDARRLEPGTVTSCRQSAADYPAVATSLDGWSLQVLDVHPRLLAAPTDERAGALGWIACVLAPNAGIQTIGSLHALESLSDRSPGFGTCVDGLPRQRVDCSEPHSIEFLGVQTADFVPDADPTDPADPAADPAAHPTTGAATHPTAGAVDTNGLPPTLRDDLRTECATLASALVGAADPSYGDQLAVSVEAYPSGAGLTGGTIRYTANCLLRTLGPRLTDSLVGWGDAPLPFA